MSFHCVLNVANDANTYRSTSEVFETVVWRGGGGLFRTLTTCKRAEKRSECPNQKGVIDPSRKPLRFPTIEPIPAEITW